MLKNLQQHLKYKAELASNPQALETSPTLDCLTFVVPADLFPTLPFAEGWPRSTKGNIEAGQEFWAIACSQNGKILGYIKVRKEDGSVSIDVENVVARDYMGLSPED